MTARYQQWSGGYVDMYRNAWVYSGYLGLNSFIGQ